MHGAGDSSPETGGSSVCDVCQGLFDMENPRGFFMSQKYDSGEYFSYSYIHYANLSGLVASANAGCTVCKIIIQGTYFMDFVYGKRKIDTIVAEESTHTDAGARVARHVEAVQTATLQLAKIVQWEGLCNETDWVFRSPERVILRLNPLKQRYLEQDTGWYKEPLRISTLNMPRRVEGRVNYFHMPYDPIDPDLEHRPSKDLLSEAHIGLINRWRDTCGAEHEYCRRTAHDQELPSRVLELVDLSDEDNGLRLVETHRKMQGKYACLSYCWGDSRTQTGQTTRDNLPKHLQRIPFNELPPTVIDAIRLCHKLGFRFLWIDRLCIVQDDPKDWSEEASRMCDVYSRSALTISAPICKESSQSFLAERRKAFREAHLFGIFKHTEKESKLKSSTWLYGDRLNRSNGPWYLENKWYDVSETRYSSENRWSQRGWTFQEWVLSPRVLHIDSMTLWDCFDGYANELNRRCMTQTFLTRGPRVFGKEFDWMDILHEYSQRKVTRVEDKLPALAGLATRYAQATGYTYLAGHWLEELPWSLLWKPQYDPNNQTTRNQHAPSWSWASSDRAIKFDLGARHSSTAGASISSVFCEYDPPESLMTVRKSWIEVEGQISVVTDQLESRSDNEKLMLKDRVNNGRTVTTDSIPDPRDEYDKLHWQ